MARKVYEGDLEANGLDSNFYLKLGNEFKRGLDEGYPIDFSDIEYNSADLLARQKLTSNLYAFSGAKSLSQIKEMQSFLTDKKGNLRSFSDFKVDALAINEKYNVNWLNTEYNNAVNSSISAANWERQVANKDVFPYLVYQTAGDSNVRAEHQRLDGTKLPVDDTFWNTYYPPNDWGCRCEAINDSGDKNLSNPKEAKERAAGAIRNKMFKNNPGKTGVVFKNDHPYFKSVDLHPNEFKAVDNYGLRGIKKIYADPNKLSKPLGEFENKAAFEKWWNAKKASSTGIKEGFIIQDQILTNKVVAGDVVSKELLKADGYKIAESMLDVIAKPNEVYQSYFGSKAQGVQTTYIKYYQDGPIVLMTKTNRSKKVTEIISLSKLSAGKAIEELRKGVLMHKM